MQPVISVIIPVKNGEATIGNCLNALFKQTIASQIEIIIIDSGSTDDTLNILKGYNVRLLSIDPSTFNHGLTRNLGVQHAQGEFLYFTVQDACLSTNDALENMVRHFTDEQVAGVCGNQGTPHDKDKNPVYWYKPISAPTVNRYQFKSPEEFEKLSPENKSLACGWDNVNALYRKKVLLEIPFVDTVFAEDLIWAKNALLKGHCIIKDSSIVTWHYHHRSFKYEFKVAITVAYYRYKEFLLIPVYPSVLLKLMQIGNRLLKEKTISMKEKIYWFFHNIGIVAADYKAAFKARQSIKKGGVSQLQLLYKQCSESVPMGRLKGQ
jgi:rhamnosyltransferase